MNTVVHHAPSPQPSPACGRGSVNADAAALLAISGLNVSYGGIHAVRDLNIEIGEGEMVCLIGANGAGKTTTLKAISGLLLPANGEIEFAGQAITRRAAHEIARAGLALVPEGRGIFPRMSVLENLLMGAYCRNDAAGMRDDIERIYTLLPKLAERRQQIAGLLSGGEQQMLALGRAMMARPRLLLLDEPSMGLAPLMVHAVFEIIRQIAASGVAIFLVEQNAHLALKTCARGYVMETGGITLADTAAALAANPAVRQAYLGE
jgi:branched-chain amino acid transport system ATP-binding protein